MLVHPLCRLSNIKPVLSWRLTSAENCSMASSLHSPVLRRPLSSDSGSALMKTLTRAILGCLLAYAIWLVSSPGGTGRDSVPGLMFVIMHGWAYTGLRIVPRHGVLEMVLCTTMNHWSHSIRVGQIPDVRLPSAAILPKWTESDVKHYSQNVCSWKAFR